MHNHTALPHITFEEGSDYDTLDSIIVGWCVKVWLKGGVILTAMWNGSYTKSDHTDLLVWSNEKSDYVTPITIPTDDVIRVSIL